MTRAALLCGALFACGHDAAAPPSAPVIEVQPVASASAGPGAQLQDPPPNPAPYLERPVASVEPPPLDPPPAPVVLSPMGSFPFDKGAAAQALGSVSLQRCKTPGGPTGAGHVSVTFDPSSGRVVSAVVDQGPFQGTPTGACIAQSYGTAKVSPFAGAPVRVGKSFLLN